MKNTVICTSLFLILITISVSYAQEAKQRAVIKGSITDELSKRTIPFVNVFNESQHKWYISQEKGTFSMNVEVGDTLVLTSIGYLGKVIVISEEDLKNEISIQLTPRQYDIEEVQVVAYKNYEDFQEAFLELDLPETRIDLVREQLQESCEKYAEGAAYNKHAEYKLQNPGLSFTIGKSGNKEKRLRQELKKKEEIQYLINKKYNRELVYRLTELEGDELTNFMGFCNFTTKFLQNATEYEIVERIMKRFETYKVLKDSTGAYDLFEDDGLNLS